MKCSIRSSARDDILRQFRFYLVEQDAPEAAQRFLDAVDQAIQQLLRMPAMGAPVTLRSRRLAGLRSWPVPGFEDIRVYYLTSETEFRVIRVLHGKRDLTSIFRRTSGRDEESPKRQTRSRRPPDGGILRQ